MSPGDAPLSRRVESDGAAAVGHASRHDPQRFLRAERLTARREYLLVQQQGKRIHLKDLVVLAYPRAGSKRIGITVSGKVAGSVQRNRIKRLVREVWRRERDQLPAGSDLVFIAKKSAVWLTYQMLRGQFAQLAQRLKRMVP